MDADITLRDRALDLGEALDDHLDQVRRDEVVEEDLSPVYLDEMMQHWCLGLYLYGDDEGVQYMFFEDLIYDLWKGRLHLRKLRIRPLVDLLQVCANDIFHYCQFDATPEDGVVPRKLARSNKARSTRRSIP